LRSYGGAVTTKAAEAQLGDSSEITINFSREIKFPREVLQQYDMAYQEKVPELQLSDEDEKQV